MTIKALYPTTRPTLDLNFARTRALDPRITYTRASTGTFVGSNGLIQSAAVNQARFEHNPLTGESLGLLLEEARTNSLWPSEPTTAASRNTAGSPGNTWAVYDGTVSSASRNAINGLEVTISPTLDSNGFTGGNTTNWGGIGGGGNQAGGSTGSVSLFINPLTWTGNIWIGRLPQDGNTTFVAQTFQLFNNGIYTGPASNVKAIFSDGTYWLHNIAWTDLSTNTAVGQFLVLFTTTPGDNIKKFWAGGFQWEAGAFSTSYIPTTTTTVTRAADVASVATGNFNAFNSTFLFTGVRARYVGGQRRLAQFVGSNGENRLLAQNDWYTSGPGGGHSGPALSVDSNFARSNYALGFNYNGTTTIKTSSQNGSTTAQLSASGQVIPDNPVLTFGAEAPVTKTIQRIAYWPTLLSSSVLQALTQ